MRNGPVFPDQLISTTAPDGEDGGSATPALGAPIRVDGGEQHGTLWVVAEGSRAWSLRERRLLREIAICAAEEIELRLAASLNSTPIHVATDDPNSLPATALLRRGNGAELHTVLRSGILSAIHEGRAETGTRLPSIREVADLVDTSRYAVLRAYRSLEAEGIVETRHRSGVYVASLGESPDPELPETADWLGRVITEGYLHQVKLPRLPSLIQRWTSTATIRCACAESSEDYRAALLDEVGARFGLEAVSVAVPGPDQEGATTRSLGAHAERALAAADLVVTTPFHAPAVGSIAGRLGIPLIVATLDEDSSSIATQWLGTGHELVVICVDVAFGDRLIASIPRALRSLVRVLTIADGEALQRLDRAAPVLMTGAAQATLTGEKFRLLAAHYPSFSRRFAERLARVILEINLRGPEGDGGGGRE